MPPPWYRTADWTEADTRALPGRLKRYKTASDKAQVLRLKAYYLSETGDPEKLQVAEDLLKHGIALLTGSDVGETYGELHSAWGRLAHLALRRGDLDSAERCYREALAASRHNAYEQWLADVLSRSCDPAKLREALHLLDRMVDEGHPQLAFITVQKQCEEIRRRALSRLE